MKDYKATINAIDDAVIEHINTHRKQPGIVTGWIVLASTSDSKSAEMDGYVLQASPGLSHHAQVGLLNIALDDKKNIGMLSTIRALMMGGED